MHRKRIEVIAFTLQGFGNELIKALLEEKDKIFLKQIYTRKNPFKFNFYECETIEKLCEIEGIPYLYVTEKGPWECMEADLGICSTFHRILKDNHFQNVKKMINIHPSLLPAYKGGHPFTWMLKNGEQVIGVSAHLMSDKIDGGPIIFQEKMLNPYLDERGLRKSLASLSKILVKKIIEAYPHYHEIKTNYPASYYPRRKNEDAIIDSRDLHSVTELIHHIKAFTNFPMPKIRLENGEIFIIDYETILEFREIEIKNEKFLLPGYRES